MATPGEPFIETSLSLPFEVDAGLTLRALWHGPGDTAMRLEGGQVLRATRLASGPATVRVTVRGSATFGVEAWGAGADEAISRLPALLGATDEPAALEPRHPLIAELVRRWPGLRMTRSCAVFDSLLPAIVGQKVTGFESSHSYWALLRRYGEPAPGPFGLRLPPSPEVLAAEPYWRFHRLGIEQRRADVIRRAALVAPRLEAILADLAVAAEADDAAAGGASATILASASAALRQRLTALPGVGQWTAAETIRPALGDPDAVSIGDYHLPHLVSWALAGEPRGSDERMLELLAPYGGQRARVVMLLELSGLRAPRYGPRMAARSIASI